MTRDMMELIPQPQELDVIPLHHAPQQIIVRGRRKRIRHKRERRDKARRWLIGIAAASLTMNLIEWVIIYILQAGPI